MHTFNQSAIGTRPLFILPDEVTARLLDRSLFARSALTKASFRSIEPERPGSAGNFRMQRCLWGGPGLGGSSHVRYSAGRPRNVRRGISVAAKVSESLRAGASRTSALVMAGDAVSCPRTTATLERLFLAFRRGDSAVGALECLRGECFSFRMLLLVY